MKKIIIKYYRIKELGKIIFKIAASRSFFNYEILGILKAGKIITRTYSVAKPHLSRLKAAHLSHLSRLKAAHLPHLIRLKAALIPCTLSHKYLKPKKRSMRRKVMECFKHIINGRAPPP